MLSEQNLNIDQVSSMDSTMDVNSILNFDDCPSISNCTDTKKNESFAKKVPLKILKCYVCDKTFSSFSEVVMHLKLIHNACAFKDCSKVTNFKLHSAVCINRGLGCTVCNKKFHQKHLLLMHFNEHIDAAFYACDVCREGFQQRKDLQKHFFQVHNKFLSILVNSAHFKTVYQKCQHCSKYFKLFSELEEHVSLCDTLTYACSFCKIGFASAYALEEHKQAEHKHEQALKGHAALKYGKRYFCGICYYGFYKGDVLREHVLTHNTERTFICDVCCCCFSDDEDLQKHYLQHIEEHYILYDVISKYSCVTCYKIFKNEIDLKDHLMFKSCKSGSRSSKKLSAKMFGGIDISSDSAASNYADAPFDFSNIPVYVLKVGEDLLNCDDSQCIVVMDLTSLFVLQRGTCASESRMPDVRNSEVYSESEVVDASLLESHMLSILSPCNANGAANVDSVECTEKSSTQSRNVETVVLNVNEDSSMQCESVSVAEDKDSDNTKEEFEFLVYNNTNSDIAVLNSDTGDSDKVRENMSFDIEDYIASSSPRESLIESDSNVSGLFVCNVCKQVFSSKTSLSLHVKGSHTGHDCCQCGESFDSKEALKSHERVVHLSEFQCDLCEMSFQKELSLKNHRLLAHGFICNMCNKSCASKTEYDSHMMLHRGEAPPTKCEECGKVYASVGNYLKHKATHAPTKKYLCTICDRVFDTFPPLKLHLSTHMRQSPYNYECPKCKMYFPPKILNKHLESHVDIISS